MCYTRFRSWGFDASICCHGTLNPVITRSWIASSCPPTQPIIPPIQKISIILPRRHPPSSRPSLIPPLRFSRQYTKKAFVGLTALGSRLEWPTAKCKVDLVRPLPSGPAAGDRVLHPPKLDNTPGLVHCPWKANVSTSPLPPTSFVWAVNKLGKHPGRPLARLTNVLMPGICIL